MNQQSLMQLALGEQWRQLPDALKDHYKNDETGSNLATGQLSIDYPRFMQVPLNVMRLLGALINRRGENLATTVVRKMEGERQYWHRTINYHDGKQVHFKSQFIYLPETNEFIEYTNRMLGLKMKVYVENEQLHYQSCGYVMKLGSLQLPIPEWLALGHASIVESERKEGGFDMDFRLQHPLFGEIFSYAGSFKTINL